ncbi:hypothetical protein MUK42_17753, partial [Musa troglodytarum]
GEGGWNCGGSRTASTARCASLSAGAASSRRPTSSPSYATPRSPSWSSPLRGSCTNSPASSVTRASLTSSLVLDQTAGRSHPPADAGTGEGC